MFLKYKKFSFINENKIAIKVKKVKVFLNWVKVYNGYIMDTSKLKLTNKS